MRVGQGLCDYINKAYCFRFKTKEVIMKKQSTPGSRLPDSLNSGLSSFFSFLSCFLFFFLKLFSPGGRGEGGGGYLGMVTCWVCAAGLSESLPHYSLFCGNVIDPILVFLGKK